jgi:hypothetical protein
MGNAMMPQVNQQAADAQAMAQEQMFNAQQEDKELDHSREMEKIAMKEEAKTQRDLLKNQASE